MAQVGRPREFDRQTVLQQAMFLFWHDGYKGVSVRELESTTGLKASSLYHGFGSKEGLFVAVLEHYQQQVIEARIARYLQPDKGFGGLREFFTSVYRQSRPYQSCLISNTWVELGASVPSVYALLNSGSRRVKQAFECQLIALQGDGILSPGADIDALGDYLLLGLQGVLVTARIQPNKKKLDRMVDTLLQVLFTVADSQEQTHV